MKKMIELETELRRTRINDIQIAGFVDQTEALSFQPMLQFIYLSFGSHLLELRTVGTTGTMCLSFAEGIRHGFDIEDGMQPATMSLNELVLLDPEGSNELVELRFWSPIEVGEELRCSAMRLDLNNGQKIFVDPTYHFGFRLGGLEQERIWRENWPNALGAPQHVLRLSE
jgi:hypothetical protein